METSTPTATPPRPHNHRIRAAARSVSPSSVIAVTVALVLGGATVASAANGGNFLPTTRPWGSMIMGAVPVGQPKPHDHR